MILLKLIKLFKKKKQNGNTYSKLGSLGISPQYMQMYKNSIDKLNENKK